MSRFSHCGLDLAQKQRRPVLALADQDIAEKSTAAEKIDKRGQVTGRYFLDRTLGAAIEQLQ